MIHRLMAAGMLLLALSMGGCSLGPPGPTPTPTKTPRPRVSSTPTAAIARLEIVPAAPTARPTATPSPVPTSSPTATPSPVPTASATPVPPTPSPTATDTATATSPPPTPTATATPSPTPAPAAAATSRPTPKPSPRPVATLPPQSGASWDMEDGFYQWPSPYEGFTAMIANGWQPLIKLQDPQAPPRLNENKYLPNRYTGERSQEISFDWRSGEAGLWRTAATVPGNRYAVEAWAKYAPSIAGLTLYLGIDLTGGDNFQAGTVTWYPWRDMTAEQWVATRETVRAKGDRISIFLRSVHPLAGDGGNKPGGNTMFDNVSVTDLGR